MFCEKDGWTGDPVPPLRELPRWCCIDWETLRMQLERFHSASALFGAHPLFESSLRRGRSLEPGVWSCCPRGRFMILLFNAPLPILHICGGDHSIFP